MNLKWFIMTNNRGLKNRNPLSNAVKTELYNSLRELSKETKVPISRLLDEAIEHFFTLFIPRSKLIFSHIYHLSFFMLIIIYHRTKRKPRDMLCYLHISWLINIYSILTL